MTTLDEDPPTPEEEAAARAEITCPRCTAQPGDPCHDSAGNPMPRFEGDTVVHPARIFAWRELQG